MMHLNSIISYLKDTVSPLLMKNHLDGTKNIEAMSIEEIKMEV